MAAEERPVQSGLDPRYRFSDSELAMLQGTWPMELILDPKRQPRIIDDPCEFIKELLIGDHLDDFVLLPNGTDKLDMALHDVVPEDLRQALSGCGNVRELLLKVRESDAMVEHYRSDIEYIDPSRQQRDVLRKEKLNLGKRIDEVLRMVDSGDVDPDLLYVAEMRQKKEVPHPIGGDAVKTICLRDVKDLLGPYAAWTLYWDRYDEGFFAGGRRSGKGVHVDQVYWSNIGRHWQGYKLVAAWPKGAVSKAVGMGFYDKLFHPPLKEEELDVLRQAAKIVLLRPGDVYFFSGGIAHTVLCVSKEMCLGAYESIVTLNPVHVEHFLRTDSTEGPYCLEKYSMSEPDFQETKDDCLDQLEGIAAQLCEGGPTLKSDPGERYLDTWRGIWKQLHADCTFQATLREHFARCVELCDKNAYFSANIVQRVAAAAQCCGATLGDAPAVKRQRCNSPGSESTAAPEAANETLRLINELDDS